MHTFIHICMYNCYIYIYVYIHTYTYACIHTCIHTKDTERRRMAQRWQEQHSNASNEHATN